MKVQYVCNSWSELAYESEVYAEKYAKSIGAKYVSKLEAAELEKKGEEVQYVDGYDLYLRS